MQPKAFKKQVCFSVERMIAYIIRNQTKTIFNFNLTLGTVDFLPLEMSDAESVTEFIESVTDRVGDTGIMGLLNNAGVIDCGGARSNFKRQNSMTRILTLI